MGRAERGVRRSSTSAWPLVSKEPESSVIRYAEELADFVLNKRAVKCDVPRLASKLKGEFVDTLVELRYAVFLARRGCDVTMEPTAPKSGPDLLAVKGDSYYVEMKRVGLDEDHTAVDAATEDVFTRFCSMPSRYSIVISMTRDYTAYSPQLKRSSRRVASVLKDLEAKNLPEATLYYHGPKDWVVREQDVRNMEFDYADREKLAAQMQEFERAGQARFVARFTIPASSATERLCPSCRWAITRELCNLTRPTSGCEGS